MKYLIPSSGRSKGIKKLLSILGTKNVLIYVDENEKKDYAKELDSSNLRTHNAHGIGAIRKFMVDENRNEDYVFMLDDDITGFEYKYSTKLTIVVDPEHIKSIVENAYQPALDLETPLFGFVSSLGPMFYNQLSPAFFSGFVNIGLGIIPKFLGDINFDSRFICLHEDHDIYLQTKYHKRFIFMDGRYSIRQKKAWLSEGGCSRLRNGVNMKLCKDLLVKKWGRSVCAPSPKKEGQFVLRVPF